MRHLSYIASLLLAISLSFITSSFAQEGEPEPLTLGYQGYVTNLDRTLVNGERDVIFRMYNTLTEGDLVWEETLESVLVSEGHFQVSLGLETPLPVTTSPDTPLFMSLQVEGDVELTPRLRVGAAIRAQWAEKAIEAEVAQVADHATDVRGEQIHPATVSIGEREVINAEGEWVGEPIEGTGGGSADSGEVATQLANDDQFQSDPPKRDLTDAVKELKNVRIKEEIGRAHV